MRIRDILLTCVLCGLLAGSAAHAANSAAFLVLRSSLNVTMVTDTAKFPQEDQRKAGQIFEIEGAVNGLIAVDNGNAFAFRSKDGQTLLFALRTDDQDIQVGAALRVLCRIPIGGGMLECLSATANTPELVASENDLDAAPAIVEPLDTRPNTNYYRPADSTAAFASLTSDQYVRIYADRIRTCNRNIEDALACKIAACLLDKSRRYGVDPRLTFALVLQESRFNPNAVSSAGARGLGQLMPGTAAGLGVRDAFDVEDNLDGSVRYLANQLQTFGRLSHALAAYNAGPNNVKRFGGVPPFRETKNYVRRIWAQYCSLAGIDPETGDQVMVN